MYNLRLCVGFLHAWNYFVYPKIGRKHWGQVNHRVRQIFKSLWDVSYSSKVLVDKLFKLSRWFLVSFGDEIGDKQPSFKMREVLIHQDWTTCAQSMEPMAKFNEIGFALLQHLPYSPVMVPKLCDQTSIECAPKWNLRVLFKSVFRINGVNEYKYTAGWQVTSFFKQLREINCNCTMRYLSSSPTESRHMHGTIEFALDQTCSKNPTPLQDFHYIYTYHILFVFRTTPEALAHTYSSPMRLLSFINAIKETNTCV